MPQKIGKIKLVSGETFYNGHFKFTGYGDYRKQIDLMSSEEIKYLMYKIERGDAIVNAEPAYAYAKIRLPKIIKKEEQEILAREAKERLIRAKQEAMAALVREQESMAPFMDEEKREKLAKLTNEEIRRIIIDRFKEEKWGGAGDVALTEKRLTRLANKEKALSHIDFKQGMIESESYGFCSVSLIYLTDKNVILLDGLADDYYIYFPSGGRMLYSAPSSSKKKNPGWYEIMKDSCDKTNAFVRREFKVFQSFEFDFFRSIMAEFYIDYQFRAAKREERNNIPSYYPVNGEFRCYE